MLKLATPWATYCNKLEALFGNDPDVTIKAGENDHSVTLFVENPNKAEAIREILPSEVSFGNVKLLVNVVPIELKKDPTSIINAAFKGNKAVARIMHISTPLTGDHDYVMFKPEVVQFFNDDLGDPHGNESTLYQDIARELLQINGVNFCTDQMAGYPF